ncbi:hypothetical protein, partial [Ralstonia sp.]|uniref:hypothetical protein n=1 Tax=Ralstonia sp. TaxID=54061 RepID=UPI00397C4DEE
FLQYTLAQILWAVDRALLTIAVIADSVSTWLSDNIGYFVELLVNALSAPLGGLLILALTALGAWYALNTIVATSRWVDPSKLLTYGFIALAFFSAPLVAVDLLEELRTSLLAGIDEALIEDAAGDIFNAGMDGTDNGLPAGVPDVNSDGVLGSFDLAAAFMHVANIDELDSSEFPADFEATYFPFGDPSSIDLSDEADQQLAKALASEGIERLLFALVAIPTAIAEHFLHLALTGVAVLLYAGVPFAMLLAFFVYTQAFLGAYLRQFANLLIETFLSVIIAAIMIGLLAAAAQQGIGLYIGASLITCFVLLWRIKSALKLASAAFELFGGGMITGGAGGMEMVNMGRQAALGTAGVAAAALTGGATVAVGGAVLGAAAALQADGQRDGAYLGTDAAKTEGRVAQLKTIAGYTLGRSQAVRGVIEGAHEVRTLSRNFRDGAVQEHEPDMLDYLRAGSSMSGFGSSPWLAMRLSPSLRAAYDEIGGQRVYDDIHPLARDLAVAYDEDGAPVSARPVAPGAAAASGQQQLLEQFANLQQALAGLTAALTNPDREALRRWAGGAGSSAVLRDARGTGEDVPPADRDHRQERQAPEGRSLHRARPEVNREPVVVTDSDQPPGSAGAIFLQAPSASREAALTEAVERLQNSASPAGRAAHEALVTYAGEKNAGLVRQAVAAHGAAPVQDAVAATIGMVAEYQRQGYSDAAILTTYQQGEASAALRATVETPLSDEQLASVADMVLLPRRQVTREELATAIGAQVAAGDASMIGLQAALGSPVHFGGQTGNIRGVIAGVQALQLSPEELARLAELIREGLWQDAQRQLLGRGHAAETVHTFIADLSGLPAVMSVPQSTVAPIQEDGGNP